MDKFKTYRDYNGEDASTGSGSSGSSGKFKTYDEQQEYESRQQAIGLNAKAAQYGDNWESTASMADSGLQDYWKYQYWLAGERNAKNKAQSAYDENQKAIAEAQAEADKLSKQGAPTGLFNGAEKKAYKQQVADTNARIKSLQDESSGLRDDLYYREFTSSEKSWADYVKSMQLEYDTGSKLISDMTARGETDAEKLAEYQGRVDNASDRLGWIEDMNLGAAYMTEGASGVQGMKDAYYAKNEDEITALKDEKARLEGADLMGGRNVREGNAARLAEIDARLAEIDAGADKYNNYLEYDQQLAEYSNYIADQQALVEAQNKKYAELDAKYGSMEAAQAEYDDLVSHYQAWQKQNVATSNITSVKARYWGESDEDYEARLAESRAKHDTTSQWFMDNYGIDITTEEGKQAYTKLIGDAYTYAQWKKFSELSGAEDFAERSKAVKGTKYDDVWELVNSDDPQKWLEEHNEVSYKASPSFAYLSDEQKEKYNYLYNDPENGPDAAAEYLAFIKPGLDKLYAEQEAQDISQLANLFPVFSSIGLRTVASLASGVGLISAAYDNYNSKRTGEYNPVNFYFMAFNAARVSGTITETRAKAIADKWGTVQLAPGEDGKETLLGRMFNGKGLADLYQLGMSIVDSTAVMALGPAGTFLLGGSAGTQGILDALERGATEDQAITMGVWNAAFETLFEYVSMDKLLNDSTGVFVKDVLTQAFTEAGEEFCTTVANDIADFFVMADKSKLEEYTQKWIDAGITDPDDARKQALYDMAIEAGWDAVGGAISGGTHTAVLKGIRFGSRYVTDSNFRTAYKQNVMANEDARSDVRTIANSAAAELTRLGENANAWHVAQAAAELFVLNENQGRSTAWQAVMGTELDEYTKYIDKKKSSLQATLDNSTYGQQVYDELIAAAEGNDIAEAANTETEAKTEAPVEQTAPETNIYAEGDSIVEEFKKKYGIDQTETIAENTAEAEQAPAESYEDKVARLLGQADNYSEMLKATAAENTETEQTEAPAAEGEQSPSGKTETEPVKRWTDDIKTKRAGKTFNTASEIADPRAEFEYTGKDGKTTTGNIAELTADKKGNLTAMVNSTDGKSWTSIRAEQLPLPQQNTINTIRRFLGNESAAVAEAYNAYNDAAKAYAEKNNGDKLNIGNYMLNYSAAASMGAEGVLTTSSTYMNSSAVEVLGEQVAQKAYETGKGIVERRNAVAKKAIAKAEKKGKGIALVSVDKDTVIGGERLNAVTEEEMDRDDLKIAAFYAKALGADLRLFKGDTDVDGKFTGASNGMYHNGVIYLDINAGMVNAEDFARRSVLQTLSHELTHYMQAKTEKTGEYAQLKDFVKTHLGEDFEKFVQQKISRDENAARSQNDGELPEGYRSLSRADAEDEVIADACEMMLLDRELAQKLARENMNLFEKICDFVEQFIKRLEGTLEELRLNGKHFHNESLRMEAYRDELQAIWNKGIMAAANAEKASSESITGKQMNSVQDEKGKPLFQLKTMKEDVDFYKQDLIDAGLVGEGKPFSKTELDQLFVDINRVMDYVEDHLTDIERNVGFREMDGTNRPFMPYKDNADPHYKMALDYSTLCRKRLLTQAITERLQSELGRALSPVEQVKIRNELKKLQAEGKKIDVACALCYVEAARLKSPKVINEFLNNKSESLQNYFSLKNKRFKNEVYLARQAQWKAAHGLPENATKADIKAAGIKVADFNKFLKDVRTGYWSWLEKYDPETFAKESKLIQTAESMGNEEFLSASSLAKLNMNPETSDLYDAFIFKVRSATRSKAQETDVPYKRGDINKVGNALIEQMNEESGFRHQSWSDFQAMHMLDTIAAIIELSTKGAKVHTYTKVADMVRFLGNTGIMMNMSLIPNGNTGIDENGALEFDPVEGIPYEDMLELRDAFPDTAGNIAIGISDKQILEMLASPNIDYVIPYHTSGLNADMRRRMGIKAWQDYSHWQNEKGSGTAPALNEWFDISEALTYADGYAYMEKASEKYLQLCAERGLVPKFPQFLKKNSDGSYSLRDDARGYWKLLVDRKMVNQITKGVIAQKAVLPKFNVDTMLGILESEVNSQATKDAREAEDYVVNKLLNEGFKTTTKEDARQAKVLSNLAAVMAVESAAQDMKVRKQVKDTSELEDTMDDVISTMQNGEGRPNNADGRPADVSPNDWEPYAKTIRETMLEHTEPKQGKVHYAGKVFNVGINTVLPAVWEQRWHLLEAAVPAADVITGSRFEFQRQYHNVLDENGATVDRYEIRTSAGDVWIYQAGADDVGKVYGKKRLREFDYVYELDGDKVQYQKREDNPEILDYLNQQVEDGNYITTYKAFSLIEGKLYPPMASYERDENGKFIMEDYVNDKGKVKQRKKLRGRDSAVDVSELNNKNELPWIASEGNLRQEQIDSKPHKDPNGEGQADSPYEFYLGDFSLDKSSGKAVPAAYNPYQHSSNGVLNDQFEEAWNRPEIVVVECRIAKSEIEGERNWLKYDKNDPGAYDYEKYKYDPSRPYFARYAKNSTGKHDWKSGPIAGQMNNFMRSVYMTRWIQPVRILSNAEVAQKIAGIYENENSSTLRMYWNTINPDVLPELIKQGVEIDPYGSPNYLTNHDTGINGMAIPQEVRDVRAAEKEYKKYLDRAEDASSEKGYNSNLEKADEVYDTMVAPANKALQAWEKENGVSSRLKYPERVLPKFSGQKVQRQAKENIAEIADNNYNRLVEVIKNGNLHGENQRNFGTHEFRRLQEIYGAEKVTKQSDRELLSAFLREAQVCIQKNVKGEELRVNKIPKEYYTAEMLRCSLTNEKYGFNTLFFLDEMWDTYLDEDSALAGIANWENNTAYVKANASVNQDSIVSKGYYGEKLATLSGLTTVTEVSAHERLHLLIHNERHGKSTNSSVSALALFNLINDAKGKYVKTFDEINYWYQRRLPQGGYSFDDYSEEIACDLYAGALRLENKTVKEEIVRLVNKIDDIRYQLKDTADTDLDVLNGGVFADAVQTATEKRAYSDFKAQIERMEDAKAAYADALNALNGSRRYSAVELRKIFKAYTEEFGFRGNSSTDNAVDKRQLWAMFEEAANNMNAYTDPMKAGEQHEVIAKLAEAILGNTYQYTLSDDDELYRTVKAVVRGTIRVPGNLHDA